MKNIAIRLSYNGTAYHGWQKQENAVTVQEVLQSALSKICDEEIKVTGCGRTDAGVHAIQYCANFRTQARIPVERLPLAVNALLPGDISVSDAVIAPEDFNAILSCVKKEYTYKIYNARIRSPFYQQFAWFYPQKLNCDIMAQAARTFVGTKDFKAVRSVGTQTKTTVRTVHYYDVSRQGDLITLKVCADGFLYNMVRAMTGTLIYASMGKILPSEIPELLEIGDRRLTGPTVPPQGLYMSRVWYLGNVGKMMD